MKNKILIAASELAPFARSGGLGSILSSLASSLKKLDQDIAVILPRYRCTRQFSDQHQFIRTIPIPISDRFESADLYETSHPEGFTVYLIDNQKYYDRDELYRTEEGDYLDNAERFIFFSRAVVELLPTLADPPRILHCNDWQTGLVPVYLHHLRNSSEYYATVRTLFTIHNLAFQGLFWRYDMHLTGLPWEYFIPENIEFFGDLNLLKGGIKYADAVNTVSPQYCKEIQTLEYGCGLDGFLRANNAKLSGILNGVDYSIWNPATDKFLPANYDEHNLDAKRICKKHLLNVVNLKADLDKPIIGLISRLNSQKGMDLFEQVIPDLVRRGFYIIVLGVGDRNYTDSLTVMANQHPTQMVFINRFDDQIAHLIHAGADMFLMPSRYEPCGMNQVFSLRYGDVPIVRKTGGLENTVIDVSEYPTTGTGFKFQEYSAQELLRCIDRALEKYRIPECWRKLQQEGMKQNFSWEETAKQYIDLYEQLLTR